MSGLDEQAASSDPLAADRFFRSELVELNRRGDRARLAAAGSTLAAAALAIERPSEADALAAVRDLGMVAASLTRHGVQIAEVGGLSDALVHMSRVTTEVPRETLYAYGPRNPDGERTRTFTGSEAERLLIRSFSEGTRVVAECIDQLLSAQQLGPAHPDAGAHVVGAAQSFRGMVAAMVAVRSGIPPEVFTYEIRPYFQPYQVGGTTFIATGGGQLPVFLIDMLAWVEGARAPVLHQYNRENVSYLPPHLRQLADDLEGLPSLLGRCAHLARSRKRSPGLLSTLQGLDLLLANLERFRFPHKRVTDENLRLRSYGPYQGGILERVLAETARARAKVHRLLAKQQQQ